MTVVRARRARGARRVLTAGAALAAAAGLAAGCGTQAHSAAASPGTAPSAGAASVRTALAVPAGNDAYGSPKTVTVPRGWTAEVWALVPDARLEAWTPEGRLLVSSPGTGTVSELTPGQTASAPPTRRTILSGLTSPQGLAFARLRGREYLFLAESTQIDRYAWQSGAPRSRTVIAHDLPTGGSHPLKNVVVSPHGTVYFDIGSATNADPPSATTPPRATVIRVGPDGSREAVFASGVRNGDGLSFAPDGTLWTAVNMRDNVAYPFHASYGGHRDAYGQVMQGYVNDHPSDEVARLTAGRDLGWPYCDPDPDVHPGHAGTTYGYANPRFDDDAQTNPGGRALRCSKLTRIQVGLPAHSAPLGLSFLEGSRLPAPLTRGAVVAVHGSWDRQPPRAPAVLWLPWNSHRRTLGPSRTLIGGFQNTDGSRWGRPVDAVPGPDGALYVSDDQAGAVYRFVPPR